MKVYLSFIAGSILLVLASAGSSRAQPASLTMVSQWGEGYIGAVAVRDTLVVVGSDTSLVVLSIADPASPRELSRMPSPSEATNDIVLRDEYAFVAGGFDGGAGAGAILSTINLADARNPVVADSVPADWWRDVGHHVRFRGDSAFVPTAPGMAISRIYDVSDPHDIEEIGSFTSVALDVAFTDHAYYTMTGNGASLFTVSEWSPLDTEYQGRFGPNEWRQSGEVLDDRLYMVGTGFHIYDISSDSALPVRLGGMDVSAGGVACSSELTLANDLVYIAASEHGLMVIDASDATEPRIVAYFDIACAEDVAVSDGLIFLAAGDDGLYVLQDDAETWKATETDTEKPAGVPVSSHLESVYPNPASGTVHARYRLAQPAHVRMQVYDLLGRRVAELAEGTRTAGSHELAWRSDGLSAGTYVIQLEMGDVRQSRFVHLVK